MLPDAKLCHSSPGRVRVRVPALRRDEEYFRGVEQALAGHFCAVAADSATGSVLITGGDASAAALQRVAAEEGLFTLAVPAAAPASAESTATRPAANDDGWARTVAALFAALAIVQAARGALLAPATSLAWYAVEALRWSQDKK
jgi:hypothetical protein